MSFKDDIKSILENQPYQAKCYECGKDLDVDGTEVDGDLDMIVTIAPCQTCIDSAVEEAKEE